MTAPDLMSPPAKGPAILVYDVETSPVIPYTWGAYQQNIIGIKEDWALMCFAYKWHGTRRVEYIGYNTYAPDRSFKRSSLEQGQVVRDLHTLFNIADIAVAHNGDRFDRKKANTEFLRWGMGPTSPVQHVDTLKLAKRNFAFTKNTLDHVAKTIAGIGKRTTTGFDLWLRCLDGDPAAWREMERYNKQDVRALDAVYPELRSFLMPGQQGGPNMAHFAPPGKLVCSRCGHDKVTKRGFHRTLVTVWQTFQCNKCNAYSRERVSVPKIDGGVRTV